MTRFDPAGAFAVQPKDVEHITPWLRPFLDRFEMETALVTADDVIEQAKSSAAQLWSYYDGTEYRGVIATRIHTTAAGRLCNLWVCVGLDADELIDGMLGEIETWARGIGCHALEVVGRKGWSRKLEPRGFTREAVVLVKRLGEVH